MAFVRQYVLPFLILLVFLVALVAVSSRSFLPSDMAAPAPMEDVDSARESAPTIDTTAGLPTVDEPMLPTSAGSVLQ